MLAGLGRHGVIVAMTVKLIRIDKYTTILKNEQTHYRTVDNFIAGSSKYIYDPGDALYERGVYVEFLKSNGKPLGIGQFSRTSRHRRGTRGSGTRRRTTTCTASGTWRGSCRRGWTSC